MTSLLLTASQQNILISYGYTLLDIDSRGEIIETWIIGNSYDNEITIYESNKIYATIRVGENDEIKFSPLRIKHMLRKVFGK